MSARRHFPCTLHLPRRGPALLDPIPARWLVLRFLRSQSPARHDKTLRRAQLGRSSAAPLQNLPASPLPSPRGNVGAPTFSFGAGASRKSPVRILRCEAPQKAAPTRPPHAGQRIAAQNVGAPTFCYFSSPPSSEKSAMVVNSRNNSARSAKRFLRTASSSAITITSSKKRSTALRVPAISSRASV